MRRRKSKLANQTGRNHCAASVERVGISCMWDFLVLYNYVGFLITSIFGIICEQELNIFPQQLIQYNMKNKNILYHHLKGEY